MSKYKRLVKNSFLFGLGNLGSKIITFLLVPFYTLYLSNSEYGEIDFLITTIALIIPFVSLSMSEGIFRFSLNEDVETIEKVVTNSLVIFTILFIFFVFAMPIFAIADLIRTYIFEFYFLVLIQTMNTLVKQFARSINYNIVYVISDMIYTFVFLILNIIFIFIYKLGVHGFLLSMIIGYTIDSIFLLSMTSMLKYFKIKNISKNWISTLVNYCLPLTPNLLMWWIINVSDRYMLKLYFGFGVVGIYAIANKFPMLVANIYNIFLKAWQISSISEYDSNDAEAFYSNVYNAFYGFIFIFASIYILANRLIFDILISNEFNTGWKIAPILLFGTIYSCLSGIIGANYSASKKTKRALWSSSIGAVINLILNILLIPRYNLIGASVSTGISFFMMWLYRLVDSKNFVKIQINYHIYFASNIVMILQIIFSIYLPHNLIYYIVGVSFFAMQLLIFKELLKYFINFFMSRIIKVIKLDV